MITNLDRARLVADRVQIRAVDLKEAKLSSDVPTGFSESDLDVSHEYRTRYEKAEPNRVLVYVDFHCAASRPIGEAGPQPTLDLSAIFRVLYELRDGEPIPEDAFEHFAGLNGPYNAWPYWRELVQTCAARVGLPRLMTPVFHPPVRVLEEEKKPKGAPSKAPSKKRTQKTG